MGTLISTLARHVTMNVNRYVSDSEKPVCYVRSANYFPGGAIRPQARRNRHENLKKLVGYDYVTRELLHPIINSRVKSFQASQKYFQSDIDYLLYKFPEWDEARVYDLHDLFQVFETHEDGIIDLDEMCMALDNLGDTTPRSERMEVLASADDDETGTIDFEEFLAAIYELEIIRERDHPLKFTFSRIEGDVRFLRFMTTPQQIRAGFF